MLAEFEGADLDYPFEKSEFDEGEDDGIPDDVYRPDQFHPKYFSWKMWRDVPMYKEDENDLFPARFDEMLDKEITTYLADEEEGIARTLLLPMAYMVVKEGKGMGSFKAYPCLEKTKLPMLMDIPEAFAARYLSLSRLFGKIGMEVRDLPGTEYVWLPELEFFIEGFSLPYFVAYKEDEHDDLQRLLAAFFDDFVTQMFEITQLQQDKAELAQIDREARVPRYELPALRPVYLRCLFNEMERVANCFLKEWFDDIKVSILGEGEDSFRVALSRACDTPDSGLKYPLEEGSAAERLWATLSILEGIDWAFEGLYLHICDTYKSEYSKTGEVPSFYPEDPESIKEFILQMEDSIRYHAFSYELEHLPRHLKAWTKILCIDEPELHLHAAAQRKLALQIQRICRERTSIVLATHSPYFLNISDAILVRTDMSHGPRRIETRLEEGFDTREARLAMGWTSGEFLIGLPHIIFVEGPVDQAFLETLYGDFLKNWRIGIIPLGGTYRLGKLINPLTDMLAQRMDDMVCSFILDKANESIHPYFVAEDDEQSKAESLASTLIENINTARRRNKNDENETVFIECIEALKMIEAITGKGHVELGIGRVDWEKAITSSVRDGDYREIDTSSKAIRKIVQNISDRLEKDPYIAILRLWRRGWTASLYLLEQKDILYYLNMKVVGRLHGLDNKMVTELMRERRDIKGTIFEITGYHPSERFVREVCMEMVKEDPTSDGLSLIRPAPLMLDEISGIIERIAMRQGYIP